MSEITPRPQGASPDIVYASQTSTSMYKEVWSDGDGPCLSLLSCKGTQPPDNLKIILTPVSTQTYSSELWVLASL